MCASMQSEVLLVFFFFSFQISCDNIFAFQMETDRGSIIPVPGYPLCLVLGQVWYLIVSIPDLCTITYFYGYKNTYIICSIFILPLLNETIVYSRK